MTAHFNSINDAMLADVWDGHVETEHRPGFYRNLGKRMFEVAAVAVALPVILPAIGLLSLPILLKGENPFFSQRRVGKNGKTFVMLKLRSMVSDSDERLARYLRDNPEAREEWIRHQKLRDDPRITPYGRFLRKTSLDELPQFLNVLRGDMAIIGPRPMLPHQRALYRGTSYYALRPGISGYWQVSDRNECEFGQRVLFDDLYDRTISFATDLGLILRTFVAVFRGTGV